MRVNRICKLTFLSLICCAAASFTIPSAHAKSHADEAKAILDRADAVMDISVPGSKPFQMAAGFHLFGNKENDELARDGMYTEI
jgi:hypothetical protein